MAVGQWVIYICFHLFKLYFLFTLWLSSILRLLFPRLMQSFHTKSSWTVPYLHSSCWHQCFIHLVLKCTESKYISFQCWGMLLLESLAQLIFIKQGFSCQQYTCPHVLHPERVRNEERERVNEASKQKCWEPLCLSNKNSEIYLVYMGMYSIITSFTSLRFYTDVHAHIHSFNLWHGSYSQCHYLK